MTMDEKIRYIELTYPVRVRTELAGLVTAVRRMKAERDFEVPVNRRTVVEFSGERVKQEKATSKEEWDGFFANLSAELLLNYPEHWERLFGF